VTGRWFSLGTPISSNNKTDRRDITQILLQMTLNTINPNQTNLILCFQITFRKKNFAKATLMEFCGHYVSMLKFPPYSSVYIEGS